MSREFLTNVEINQFKYWLTINNMRFNEQEEDEVTTLTVYQGQYHLEIRPANPEADLYEVFDYSDRQTALSLLKDFYDKRLFIYGVKTTRHLIERYIPEETVPFLECFDHFRIYKKEGQGWTVFGVCGHHMEILAVGTYKMALRVFGPNFLEEYWTVIFTMQKENDKCFLLRI
jgi:hypothetical protein